MAQPVSLTVTAMPRAPCSSDATTLPPAGMYLMALAAG
jgi:hypothetical protein